MIHKKKKFANPFSALFFFGKVSKFWSVCDKNFSTRFCLFEIKSSSYSLNNKPMYHWRESRRLLWQPLTLHIKDREHEQRQPGSYSNGQAAIFKHDIFRKILLHVSLRFPFTKHWNSLSVLFPRPSSSSSVTWRPSQVYSLSFRLNALLLPWSSQKMSKQRLFAKTLERPQAEGIELEEGAGPRDACKPLGYTLVWPQKLASGQYRPPLWLHTNVLSLTYAHWSGKVRQEVAGAHEERVRGRKTGEGFCNGEGGQKVEGRCDANSFILSSPPSQHSPCLYAQAKPHWANQCSS